MHPRSKHWHLLDYVLVKAVDLQDVQITRVMCGAECWTDHVSSALRSAYAFAPQPENRNLSVGLKSAAWGEGQIRPADVQPYCKILHRSQIVHLCRFKAARTLQNSGTH